jgi:hypothetical protein
MYISNNIGFVDALEFAIVLTYTCMKSSHRILFVQNGVLVGKMFVLKVLDDLRTM